MPRIRLTVLLLSLSNLFMAFARYARLKKLSQWPWWIAARVSCGIAPFEDLLQVPGNRIGCAELSIAQLKTRQEVIPLAVFVPFPLPYLRQGLRPGYRWAGCCMIGAVLFRLRRQS